MSLLPVNRNEAPYASAAELLTQDDRPTMDIRVPGWERPNGEPVFVRIRALSLSDRNWINQTSGIGEKRSELLFVLASLQRGIVAPPLNWQQAQLLADRNERILEILCDTIWELAAFDQTAINNLVSELAGVAPVEGPEAPALGAASDGTSSVDVAPGE